MGWIITALACTPGAPFWFDALSKLVKLRSSGAPPATAKGADSSGAPPGSQLARSAAASAAGVSAAGVPRGGATDQGDEFAVKPRIAMSDALNDAERALDAEDVKRVQRGMRMADADCQRLVRRRNAAGDRGVAAQDGDGAGHSFRHELAALLSAGVPVLPPIPAAEPDPPPGAAPRPTLRRGAAGAPVAFLQRALGLHDDGLFGPRTEAAVRVFQRSENLVPDGIVGPRTWARLPR